MRIEEWKKQHKSLSKKIKVADLEELVQPIEEIEVPEVVEEIKPEVVEEVKVEEPEEPKVAAPAKGGKKKPGSKKK